MPRKRTIEPDFFLDENLGKLHPLTRILFVGLWCLADREGRLQNRPEKIKVQILPYDKHDIEKSLEDLEESGHIIKYQIENDNLIQIKNFKKHQRPHHTEKNSELPALNGYLTVNSPLNNGYLTVNSPLLNGELTVNSPSRDNIYNNIYNNRVRVNNKITTARNKIEKIDFDPGRCNFVNLSTERIKIYQEKFPAINVKREIKKMESWLMDNPKNRKSNYGRFITNWLSRTQDKASRFDRTEEIQEAQRKQILADQKKLLDDFKQIDADIKLIENYKKTLDPAEIEKIYEDTKQKLLNEVPLYQKTKKVFGGHIEAVVRGILKKRISGTENKVKRKDNDNV